MRGSPVDERHEPAQYTHTITARGGTLTYRVVAHRPLEYEEIVAAVRTGLNDGRLAEPNPGAIATLVIRSDTDFGRHEPMPLPRVDPDYHAWERDLLKTRQNARRRHLRVLSNVVIVLVLALGYYVSPLVGVYRIASAVEARDVEDLGDSVDFAALRESLRGQMTAFMARETAGDPDMKDNPFAAIGVMLAAGMIDALVSRMTTPDGLVAILTVSEANSETRSPNPSPLDYAAGAFQRGAFEGPFSYRVEREGAVWRFRLDGLTWRLFDVRMPLDDLADAVNEQ